MACATKQVYLDFFLKFGLSFYFVRLEAWNVPTTQVRSYFINNTFRPQANLLYQTCIAGLVKHLSPHTGHISECGFAHTKCIPVTKCWHAFNGNVAIFIIDKW